MASTVRSLIIAQLHRRGGADARLIEASGLFDREWYLAVNPDVREAGIDAAVHYLRYGAAEGRNPSPQFDGVAYWEAHPEARSDRINPLLHYLRQAATRRDTKPSDRGGPRILIVGALEIPQCFRYRVRQRQRHCNALGVDCTILDWRQVTAARAAVDRHDAVIFYRVPGHPEQLALIEAAQRRGLATFWEVDDLIFDRDAYLANGNFHRLPEPVRDTILGEIPKCLQALQACGCGIASTPGVATAMRNAGVATVYIIENALDAATEAAGETARARRATQPRQDALTIFYGSGSSAHDADFACAAPAIAEVMRLHAHVKLSVIGELALPPCLDDLSGRVVRLPYCRFDAYLGHLAAADINMAPLQNCRYNDGKSTIKYIEASALGLASVCSPRAPFKEIISHGANGLLAETADDWRAALLELVTSRELRDRMSNAAYQTVRLRYDTESIAQNQLAPLLADLCRQRSSAGETSQGCGWPTLGEPAIISMKP
jgi:O-antigen biosynthesis protein